MLETSLETSLLSFKTAMVTIETVEREREREPPQNHFYVAFKALLPTLSLLY